eukprot:6173996-Pleurochrysis_carterae.AAC.4
MVDCLENGIVARQPCRVEYHLVTVSQGIGLNIEEYYFESCQQAALHFKLVLFAAALGRVQVTDDFGWGVFCLVTADAAHL